MYPNQAWVPQSVDESEDDEVQGIFSKSSSAPKPPSANPNSSSSYDDVVQRFSGLMSHNAFNGSFAHPHSAHPYPQQHLETQAATYPTLPPNYLQSHHQSQQQQQNAEMLYHHQQMMVMNAAHLSGALDMQHQSSYDTDLTDGRNWQESIRTTHRTPGPNEKNSGPSPPNPFRYGLGLNYPPSQGSGGKSGLTPTNFAEMEQSFGYGPLPNFMHEQGSGDNSAWYEQLPQGNAQHQPQQQKYAQDGDYGGFDGSGGDFGYDQVPMRNLDFSAQFLQNMAEEGHASELAAFGSGFGLHQGGVMPLGSANLGVAPNGFYGGFTGFIEGQGMPQAGYHMIGQQQQQTERSSRHVQEQGYKNAYYQSGQGGQGLPPHMQRNFEGAHKPHPPAGFQMKMGAPPSGKTDKGAGEKKFNYSAAVTSNLSRGRNAQQPSEVPHQASSTPTALPQHSPGRKQGSPQKKQSQTGNTYYHDNRQPLAHANHRIPPNDGIPGDEEERKDKRDSVSSSGGTRVPPGMLSGQNRRVSNSIDSIRSSASSSMDSHTSKDAFVSKKKQELEESPQTRSVFKEFYKTFRAKEKDGYDEAFAYAYKCLDSKDVPEKIHWKIYLEMADLAKRENRFHEARKLYQLVNQTQPFAHQGWLEYSKMEEECGRLHQCRIILHQGLEYCNYAEQLLTKAIKHEERMGNLQGARSLLARLRNQSVDKTWRTILEGALLEARAGNIIVARKVFKYLMRHVPWYGPIYYEATKFEEKNEEFERAISIVEKGLKEIPRYGPLWFNAFRLHEKTEMEQAREEAVKNNQPLVKTELLASNVDPSIDLFEMFGITGDEFQSVPTPCPLLKTRGALQRAMNCISKELVWKVHFEAAQVAERAGGPDALEKARHAYVQSILRCPVNLRWKVWLAGARAELAHGHIDKARSLLDRAIVDVPSKSKAQVLLECSRLEEYTGNLEQARNILSQARTETRHEWKVFLESVMLEVRNGKHQDAIRAAEDALAIHSGTGRLWAILVQLKHIHGPDAQRLIFREALKQVPKSGEVWCEGARIHMHPLSPYMDLDTAQRYLQFAIQFTPQYGDSFIIALRWQLLYANFGNGKLNGQSFDSTLDESIFRENMEQCDTSDLELKCVNADPNYGSLWFHCKRGPFDTARQVLRTAKKLLIAELTKFRYVYRDAILDSIRRKTEEEGEAVVSVAKTKDRTTPALANGENTWLVERLHHVPGAEKYCDFSSGLLCVNWLREHVNLLVDAERRKFLFGSDQIVP